LTKILVVDDNEQLSSMLQDVLESWGYEVATVPDGLGCLNMARETRPDIILLDIMLPGLSGYEVCSELKRDPATRSIAVIMMTALADTESRIHGFKVGADNFLVKPINYEEIRAIIEKLLENKHFSDATENRINVAEVLHQAAGFVVKDDDEEYATVTKYCEKLLETLNWDHDAAEKTRILVRLYQVSAAARKLNVPLDRILSSLDSLEMSRWLEPALRYLAGSEDMAAALTENDCLRPAQLVQAVIRYTRLLGESEGDRDMALSVLKRDAAATPSDKEIMKRFEEILKAEQILESIG